MFFRLLLLFTLVPLVELYLLIRIGGLIGAGPTILLVLGTGAVGAWLARREGLRSWIAVQQELAAGRLPAEELLHALLVVIAGVLLVTPGVFTDAFGLLMLVRPVRAALIRRWSGLYGGARRSRVARRFGCRPAGASSRTRDRPVRAEPVPRTSHTRGA